MIDDRQFEIPSFSPVCTYCKHVVTFRRCKAFDEIPLDIWNGETPHTEPYPGDGGIQFNEVREHGVA